uniref:Uncharacterized protein n=1 Tax=Chromera velia CCMP2878 TaxID=1169474 RepID=A0A0G4IDC1_9ALVE|eukprot:Cvel_13355.t1-p1 / transcript=Cvel_13355.t1 / gene=Cvel_13355 / organism=Chromera_velia_CCMP2878 / gene_product=hypothetical protein / transcript_product=hypothetical protein / location=Cvel_scaffold907:24729-25853(+) / protein_length=375 / sequence_SO=supercontig / SO=protein_coding / is_pseudo=false
MRSFWCTCLLSMFLPILFWSFSVGIASAERLSESSSKGVATVLALGANADDSGGADEAEVQMMQEALQSELVFKKEVASCSAKNLSDATIASALKPHRHREPYWTANHRLVFVARYNEDVSWADGVADRMKAKLFVSNCNEGEEGSAFFVSPNRGHEAMHYLEFIVDYYDHLPKQILFLHGESKGWHDQISHESLLSCLKWDARPYFSVTWMLYEMCKRDKPESLLYFSAFEQLLPPEVFPRYLENFKYECCAEFKVDRERIRARPKSFWVHLRNWLICPTLDVDPESRLLQDKFTGRVFEYTWNMLMGEKPGFVSGDPCESMVDCSFSCLGFGTPTLDEANMPTEACYDLPQQSANTETLEPPLEEDKDEKQRP